jgi:regulatory protein
MKTITALKLQQKNKDRVNLFLDDEYAFAVSFSAASELRRGQELSEGQISELKQEGERNKAYHQAIRFLGVRPRSTSEMTRKLKEKGHEEILIEAVIQRLVDAGYVDDAAFARFWVEDRTRFRPRSAHALRYELRQKGVDSGVIDEAVADLDEDHAAWDAIAVKLDGWRRLDEDQFRKKATGFLGRRGFNYGIIRSTIERARSVIDDEEGSEPGEN